MMHIDYSFKGFVETFIPHRPVISIADKKAIVPMYFITAKLSLKPKAIEGHVDLLQLKETIVKFLTRERAEFNVDNGDILWGTIALYGLKEEDEVDVHIIFDISRVIPEPIWTIADLLYEEHCARPDFKEEQVEMSLDEIIKKIPSMGIIARTINLMKPMLQHEVEELKPQFLETMRQLGIG